LALLIAACTGPVQEDARGPLGTSWLSLDPPAQPSALAPNLAVVDGSVAATWLEPVAAGDGSEGDRTGHRLRFSRLSGQSWSPPITVAEGDDFFANWADLPAVVEMGNGDLLAHWLAKTAEDTYAYSIFLARSDDGGSSWRALGQLNADTTPTEHGFVSWVSEGEGARAFWLDGRAMEDGGPMALRTAHVGDVIGPEELLDEQTCECCSTDATVTEAGPVVVFRDRSKEEIRDVWRVSRRGDGWSAPEIVHADGWQIAGCPVNGPSIAARDEQAVVGWYSGAETETSTGSTVKLAFSGDGAESFEEPLVLDVGRLLGRVDVALDDRGDAWVVWIRQQDDPAAGETAEIRLQRVPQGEQVGQATLVATTSASRASGFPRLATLDGFVYVGWIDLSDGEPSRIRLQRRPLS
jgi:hypothetical protein